MLDGINKYLGTNFDFEDMDIIYTKLGNDVNRPLCEKFVDNGYDMNIIIWNLHIDFTIVNDIIILRSMKV